MEIVKKIPGKVVLTEYEATELRNDLSNLIAEVKDLPEVWHEYIEKANAWAVKLTLAISDLD